MTKDPYHSIIASNRSEFGLWAQQLNEFLEAQYNPRSLNNDEHERIFFQTNEMLISMARAFFVYGKFKDQWDTSKCSLHPFGQYLFLKSEKMNLDFHWGVDSKGFFIESYLICPENLRYMTDDFWTSVLDLKQLGEFEFTGGGGLSEAEKPYFENKTSTIFQMMRRFMLFQNEEMQINSSFQRNYLNLGELILRWDFNTDWAELLDRSCKAFKLLYKLNYQLWKISDLAQKKHEGKSH